MQKGNVDNAIKLITNNMQNVILPLTETTLKLSKQKHPKSALSTEKVLLPDQPGSIHQIKYKNINADAVQLKPKVVLDLLDGCSWLEKDSNNLKN